VFDVAEGWGPLCRFLECLNLTPRFPAATQLLISGKYYQAQGIDGSQHMLQPNAPANVACVSRDKKS